MRTRTAEATLAVLRAFAEEIDARDLIATRGRRAGPANLLLLVDQFEEVFRPEAKAQYYLLDLLIAAHAFLKQTLEGKASGLFIVVTMRTEELHRAGEHPALALPPAWLSDNREALSLADVINNSFYLIQLLDPEQDRDDLREAIVLPARNVLDEYGLWEGFESADAPFEEGVVEWLLAGGKAWRDADGLYHKADRLPAARAARAMWEAAIERWRAACLANGSVPELRIVREDLPEPGGHEIAAEGAKLDDCLDRRADEARDAAVAAFAFETRDDFGDITRARIAGLAVLRAAVRALARRDDRGNWARRFASVADIDAFLKVDPDIADVTPAIRGAGTVAALAELAAGGYVSRGPDGQYNISHEALIRNWKTAQAWLRTPTDTALAIERLLTDVDPALVGRPEMAPTIEELVPRQLADRLVPVAEAPNNGSDGTVRLPPEWAKEQISLLIGSEGLRRRWGSVDLALEGIRQACMQADASARGVPGNRNGRNDNACGPGGFSF